MPTTTTTTTNARPTNCRTRRLRVATGIVALGATALSAGCSGSASDPAAPTTRPPAVTAAPAPSVTTPATPATTDQTPTSGALVVRPLQDIVVRNRPDASSPGRTVAATTSFGSATALLVTDQAPGWVQVLVPGRPTGARAWLPSTEAGTLQSVAMEIHVDLATRTLILTDDGTEVLRTSVAIGAPATPTPTGRFSLTDKLDTQKPGGAYGQYALGLSARSEVLTDFAGGDGQIGIHGTNQPDSIGNAVSHGCIRVPNDVMERLNGLLSLGTPVVVS